MKTLAIALLMLAGCGGIQDPAETDQPASVVVSYQWRVTVTGPSWGCFGTMGLDVTDGKAASGSWSCNNDLRFPPPGRYFTGPVAGTMSGSAFALTFAASWSRPTAYPATVTLAGADLAGTIAVESETASLSATKL